MSIDDLMTEKTSDETEENLDSGLINTLDDINQLKNNIRNIKNIANKLKEKKEDSEDDKEDEELEEEESNDTNDEESDSNNKASGDENKGQESQNAASKEINTDNENADSPSRTIGENNTNDSINRQTQENPIEHQNVKDDSEKSLNKDKESLNDNSKSENTKESDNISDKQKTQPKDTINEKQMDKGSLSNSEPSSSGVRLPNTSPASNPVSAGGEGAVAANGAAAGGTTVAGGAVASGGATAAGGAVVVAESAPVIGIVIAIIAVILIFIILFTTIYSYASPKYIAETVGKATTSFLHNVSNDTYEVMKGFWYAINPFEEAPTSDKSLQKADVPIPQANVQYDPKNPQDMAYLEEYKLIQVAFSRAYDKSLEILEDKCVNCGYDYNLTMDALHSKYPNGWQDVYKNVNYGEFIIMMYFYMHDKEDIWGNSAADIQEMISDYKNAIANGSNDAITFSGKMLGMIEDLILAEDNFINLYQMGYTIASSGDKKYLNIEIKPYCWNQIYEMIGRTPEGIYDSELDMTYSEMMDLMLMNMKATNEDSLGEKRPMYFTLKLDNSGVEWKASFENNSIHDLYALCNIPEINEYNGQILYIMLRSEGYEPSQAAGICGNVRLKNFYKTEISEDGKTVGLCNWDINTDGKKLKEFAKIINADPYSIYTQSAFLISQLREDGTEEKIKAETGVRQSTDIFSIRHEKEKSFKNKSEWQNAKPGTEWESYTYSSIDNRYHYNLREYRESATDEFAKFSGLPIMFWPAPGNELILRDYGVTTNSHGVQTGHKGIDIKCSLGDKVVASACGIVKRVGYSNSEGNYIVIEHNTIYETRYLHLDSCAVKEGDLILAGQTIGYAGKTGNASEVHLHFGLRMAKEEFDGNYKYESPWLVTNATVSFEDAMNEIIKIAESAIGKIPYVYGGKASKPGFDTRWDNKASGLDCSGFVQWVYWTVSGNKISGLGSTASITSSQQEIRYSDLKPGDLGVKFKGGSNATTGNYNHVGIYAGKDVNGNDVWIHCTGGSLRNVVRNNYSGFTVYYRVNLED